MIVVVGAGIAGSSLVRHLAERDIEYTLVSQDRPASTAAVALLRRGYHHGDQLALFDRSLDLFKKWGVRVRQGGMVTNYRAPGREAREEADWYLVDPQEPLVAPQHQGFATDTINGVLVESSAGAFTPFPIAADRVLWATGASMNATGLTFGVTWVHPEPGVLADREHLRLHHFAPYKTIAAAEVAGQVRLGSSSARNAEGALEQGKKMLGAAYEVGMINSLVGWTAEIGIRCKGAEGEKLPAGHSYVGGFHRTGYAIAPATAERVVASL